MPAKDNVKAMAPLMTSTMASSPSLNISSEFEKPRLRRFSASTFQSSESEDEDGSPSHRSHNSALTSSNNSSEPSRSIDHSRNGSIVVQMAHERSRAQSTGGSGMYRLPLIRKSPRAGRISPAKWITIAAALTLISVILLSTRDSTSSTSALASSISSSNILSSVNVFNRKKKNAPFCTPYQMLRGHWEPSKTPIRSIDELKKLRGYRPYQKLGKDQGVEDSDRMRDDGLYCWPDKFNKSDPHETYESVRLGEVDRLLRVGSQVWISEAAERGECQVIAWDWLSVVRRLANSQLGIIFLGDSLTSQAFDSLAVQLGNKGPIYEKLFAPGRRLDADRGLFLDPDHELTPMILQGLDVPRSRLERPLALQHRANYLVMNDDYEDIGLESPIFPTSWENNIHWWTNNAIEMDDTDKVWKNRNIIFTNTGAWYQRWLVATDTTKRLGKLRQVAQKSFGRLSNLTRTSNFTVFYRTVNRGHSNCRKYLHAVAPGNTSAQAPLDHNGWFITPAMNDIFRETIDRHLGDHMQLLDIEEMSANRPEAHAVPEMGDCLHHCLPSMTDEWNWAWWHALTARERQIEARDKV